MPVCLACQESLIGPSNARQVFCSCQCMQDHRRLVFESQWISGLESGISKAGQVSAYVRNYLFRVQGGCCLLCQRDEWMGAPIPLELDHVDGNSFNCSPGNVRLICCNCHATTPTYKGRNRGSGRLARALVMLGADNV